jgi:hypothetical protein
MTSLLDNKTLINAIKSFDGGNKDEELRAAIEQEKLPFANWIEYGRNEYLEQNSNNREPLSGKIRLSILNQDMYRAAFFLGREIEDNNIDSDNFMKFRNYMYDTSCKYTVLGENIKCGIPQYITAQSIKDYINFDHLPDEENHMISRKGEYIQNMFLSDIKHIQRHIGQASEKKDILLHRKLTDKLEYLIDLYQDAKVIGQIEAQATNIYKTIAIGAISRSKRLKPSEEMWKRIGKTEKAEDLSTSDLVELRKHEFKYTALKLGETVRKKPHLSEYSQQLLKPKAKQYKSALEKYKEEFSDNNKKNKIQKDIDNLDELGKDCFTAGKATLNNRSAGLVQTAFLLEFEEKVFQYHQITLQAEKDKVQLKAEKDKAQLKEDPSAELLTIARGELSEKAAELSQEKEQSYKSCKALGNAYEKAHLKVMKYMGKSGSLGVEESKPSYKAYQMLKEKYNIDSGDHEDFIKYAFYSGGERLAWPSSIEWYDFKRNVGNVMPS